MTSIVYVTTNEVSIGCTFSSTEVVISNLQGPQGAPGVVQVTPPLTLDDPTDTIGINSTSGDVASYVVQRDANQRFSIGAIDWDRFSTQSSAEARLYWDGNQTLNLGLGGGNVTIALGQEVINYVTNAEATTLNVGEVVYLYGAQGDRPSVKRASNTSDTTSSKTFGIVAEAITAGGAGFVVKQGIVQKVNTAAYAEGDILWLSSTPGQFTKTKPVAPNHLVFVGVVLRTNVGNGLVYVSPQNGYELDEIHDVLLTSESDGQFLVYQSSNDLWVNKSITATSPVNYSAASRVITIDDASTSAKGAVQLSSLTNSTSEILAATPKAVKDAYDLANTANNTANAAVPQTRTISTTAPLAGGGDLTANRTFSLNTGSSLTVTGTNLVVDSTIVPYLANANTFTASPQQITGSASAKGLIIKMNATTPGNPLEIQNSSSTVLANFDSSGNLFAPSLQSPTASKATLTMNGDTGGLLITTVADANKGLVIKRSNATQTANLFEIQNQTGANIVAIDSNGNSAFQRLALSTAVPTSASRLFVGTFANQIAEILQGAASQTSDLLQLQTSAATVLGGANALAQTYTGSTTPILVATGGATTAASGTGTTATITTTSAHGLATGDLVTIAGVTPTGYNGTYLVTATPSTTQISYANTTTGSQTVAGTVSAPAQSSITTRSAGTVGQVVRAAASQVADIAQWQNSSATSLMRIAADGRVTFASGNTYINNFGEMFTLGSRPFAIGGTQFTNTTISVTPFSASIIPLAIRGAASQTANLQEWQTNAGVTTSFVSPAGGFAIGGGSLLSATVGVLTLNASTIGIVMRGVASQTADLQQWQNSSATVLARVDSAGNLNVGTGTGGGTNTNGISIAGKDIELMTLMEAF